jgi:hypothetical protein
MVEEGDAPGGVPVKINACDGSHVTVYVTINRPAVDLFTVMKLVHGEPPGETLRRAATFMAMK